MAGFGVAGGVVMIAKGSLRRAGEPQRWPEVWMWRHWKRLGAGSAAVGAGSGVGSSLASVIVVPLPRSVAREI